ncbi:MAG: condensation domain-containing protein, partial [Cyanobacteria bacterium J06632_3]
MDKQNIESIYPLTSLQQAFLWHSLQTSVQAGLLHVRCTLVGQLDEHCFRQAWDTVIAAHPALRTSVHWEGVKQPLQVVARQVQLPWTVQDWREKESVDAHLDNRLEDRLEDFLQKDRDGKALPEEDRSFDLTQAPISRISLIRLTDSSYELVWTCHHLMLDGWSSALVLNQVVDAYETLLQGQSPAVSSAPTFQSYVRWQQQQDSTATKAFWQEALSGFEHPASRLFLQDAEGPLCADERVMTREETAAVNAFLRSHRLTLNTLMQGVWSLLLQGYSQTSDVLFGATVSGRQCDLPGVESIVGLLINVLPVRVNVSESEAVLDWLQSLQRQQAAVVPHAHAALSDIQQWCGLPGRLFDSLLVIENYPIRSASAESSLRLENLKSGVVSTYGLTVLVKPGESLAIAAESATVTTEAL